MKFVGSIAGLLIGVLLAGCDSGENASPNTLNTAPIAYPTVDDSFLSAIDWRFIGPYRGGRVRAVAGTLDDPFVYYFGAAHGTGQRVRAPRQMRRRVSLELMCRPQSNNNVLP